MKEEAVEEPTPTSAEGQQKQLSESQKNPLSESKTASNLSGSKRGGKHSEPNSLSNSLKREVASMQRSLELDLPITINLGSSKDTELGKCTLCLEDDLILFHLKACGHRQACWTCLQEYLEMDIKEHHLPLRCVVVGCGVAIDNADVKEIVAPNTFVKLQRFQQMMESPDLRECPKCQTLNKRAVETSNKLQCVQCEHQYCWLHSDAHPPTQSCQEYDNPLNRSKRTEATLAKLKGVKRCPNCATPTERIDGCPMMKCQCGTGWCYNCGSKTVDGLTCIKCGSLFGDGPAAKPEVWQTVLATICCPFYLVLSLLYTTLCCPCTTAFISFLCYLKFFDEDDTELELFGCYGCTCICCFPLFFYKRWCLCCYTPPDELLAKNTRAGEKKEERRVKRFDKKDRQEAEKKRKADEKAVKQAGEEI